MCGTNQKCKYKELFFSAAAKDGNQEPRSSIPWNFLVRLPVDSRLLVLFERVL